MSLRRLNRSLVDYVGASDSEYLKRMHEIVTAPPLGCGFSEPVQLLPHVYLGSQLHAESLRQLRSNGITHVLNCAGFLGPRQHPEKSPYDGLGIGYLEFKAHDNDDYDMTQHFVDAFKYLDKVLHRGGKALVHCAMGINRSVAVCIGYLLHHKNWQLLRATIYVKEKRKLCLSNEGFRLQLIQFARSQSLLDKLPERPPRADNDALSRDFTRSLPQDLNIARVLQRGYFKKSDSLLDTSLVFRVERFMNREKV